MSELETIGLEPVESLTITTLVDNVTDILAAANRRAKSHPRGR